MNIKSFPRSKPKVVKLKVKRRDMYRGIVLLIPKRNYERERNFDSINGKFVIPFEPQFRSGNERNCDSINGYFVIPFESQFRLLS